MNDSPQSEIGRRRATATRQAKSGYADRRTQIVRAAATVFRRKGVSRATIADIAAEVGSDRASLYYYFGTKEDLLDAVITEGVERNLATAERIRDEHTDAPSKLRELIVELMVSYADHFPFLYVYLQENLDHVAPKRAEWAEHMRSMNRRYERAVETIIDQGIEEGTFEPLAPTRVMAFGAMGIVSWTNRWFDPGTAPADARTIGEAYAEIIIKGLSPTAVPG